MVVMSTETITREQRQAISDQVGAARAAISGGPQHPTLRGLEMPAGHGWHVRIELDPSDTYTVTRIFRRGLREWIHGQRTSVYVGDLSETAYRAGCWSSYSDEEW